MRTKPTIIIAILIAPIGLLVALLVEVEAYVFGLSAWGYYVNKPGREVAKIAAENRDVSVCRKMRQTWFVIGPQAGEQMALCFFDYARLTEDPSACDLLMPSRYGWSCLGAVEEKLFLGDPCYYSSIRDDVYCNKTYSEGELTIEHPQMKDCGLYARKDLREWCHFERTARLDGVHECDVISHPVVHDNCEYNYAIKMRTPLLCTGVRDGRRRDFCTRYVSLSVKYRGSRDSLSPPG